MKSLVKLSAVLYACLWLAACGGSGDSKPKPVANAGADQTVQMGETVTLDASGSSTTRSDVTLSYQWTLSGKPGNSTAQLSDATAVKPTFVADLPGTYTAELAVSDGSKTATDSVTVTATTEIPVAIIRSEYHELIGTSLLLDASASVAPTGGDVRDLEYEWTLLEKPSTSRAVFSTSVSNSNYLHLDVAGTYSASLVVYYQDKASEPVLLSITASISNTKPVANAGGSYTIERGQTLTLDGSQSSDADGDVLSYRWYLFGPGADSGLALNGIQNGSALRVETGLANANTATPSITPDVVGNWTVYLMVFDGTSLSNISSASIKVTLPENAPNTAPVASFYPSPRFNFFTAKDSNEVELGKIVWSSGNSWDVDGLYIGAANRKFKWISTPAGYEQADLSASGSFSFTPTVEGEYTVELSVNDGELDAAAPARRTFTARTGANTAPTVSVAVDSGTILVGDTGWFDARGSKDAEGDLLTYNWVLFEKPEGSSASLKFEDVTLDTGAVLKNARAGIVTDKPGAYIVLLAVTDSHGVTNSVVLPAYGRIFAKQQNNAPTVSIPGAYSINPLQFNRLYPYWGMDETQPAYTGATVVVNPIYTDPDLDTLYYLWTLDEQPAGSDLPDAATTAYHSFVPQVPGTYTYTVVASDGMATSAPQTISVKVADLNNYPALKLSGNQAYTGVTVGIGSIPDFSVETVASDHNLTLPFKSDYTANGLTFKYMLTASGGDYTIHNLQVTTEHDGTGVAQLVGLSEGQVIKNGESVKFAIVSPADYKFREHNTHLRWYFDIKERPDWSFEVTLDNVAAQ
ncbi:PKD domain-containing protein [Cellvibrio japonicus]|uniref:Putative lipoprotein n=1 Tax=Cellvibrio japonicus (strain Ueda107) TaxID=498211 RepID=B3PLQ7_CELJU|nr:PKD domain-containing protein [Cellvibrio japonicus]ACE82847.1 putative lipoprotein [Cellvibrio japonicus Ueda107]QEI13039.1 hypothetical protein FY117_12950 [Cellvibrio japonicus]QEI16613.1 hypothetical protein FY116_12955 [Cellvibrio japonicus]QEI20191.1 hypothetical protein FY115_12950 [Cellvibrio japonicus]